ncbi:hypothetical protein [Robertmurraya andreesenii]|uniref:Uncharacterized protein n=1 Tax=Anoxybacillus andreesenii TaxID=1325932 RepID=A0ABT9V1Z7_9BACL|nr:hypothetical protein [Robertmurraya andreesenii]MDQ0154978.1 hypothetical protein [Robertmurraya andreesenii]
MKKNRTDETVGSAVFARLERNTRRNVGFRLFAEEKASDLLYQSPLVVDVLRTHGVLKRGEHHAKFIGVYKANLACQRYGVIEGNSEILTTKYAGDRAKAIVEHLQKTNSPLLKDLKEKGISIHKFYYALRDLILKETLQTDYIAGITLKPETEIVTGIAVNKRLITASKEYESWLKLADINPHDDSELKDVVRESDFRSVIVDHFRDEPFYARRESAIESKKQSLTDNLTFVNVETDTAPLFAKVKGKTKDVITEKAFIHFVDTLGIDRNKLIRMLAAQ